MPTRYSHHAMTQPAPAMGSWVPGTPGQRPLLTLGPVDLLVEHFQRWFSRVRTRSAILAMSPRQRADIGVNDANIDDVITKAVDEAHELRMATKRLARARRLAVQRNRRELLALDDRELDDIGIGRCDIDRIAHATRVDMADVIAASPYAIRTTKPRAANDLRQEAVA